MSFLVSPQLGRIAIREGLELPFVVWSILRDYGVAKNLSSHYSKSQAVEILAAHGLKFTSRHYGRIWQQGVGIFWGLENNRVYLRSFKLVVSRNEAFRNDKELMAQRQAIFVKIQLSGGVEDLRAQLYWAWFTQWEEKTISRDTLRDLFGLSHDQQRSYEALLGSKLIVKSNYAHINLEAYKEHPQDLPDHHFTVQYEREIRFDETIEPVTAIQYQLPNTFLARSGDDNFIPSVDAPNRAMKAFREQNRHTESLFTKQRTYWLKWSQFESLGTLESFIRAYYQGKKRLWLSGHYL